MSDEFDQALCDLDAATLQRLNDLVARAHARTSASGVAIALVEDDDLVTCAAFGGSAPEVGTRSPIDGSFSGKCALSGEMLICADVTADDRLDGEACASAGIFSMVVVPVSESGKTRGVLAAFSDRPNSFSPNQLTVLNTFAEIANELLHHRDQAASGEAPTPVASVTDPSAKCETTVLHDVLSAYEAERRQHSASTKPATPVAPEVVVAPPAVVTPAALVTPPQKFEPAATVVPSPTLTATAPMQQLKPAVTPIVSEPKPEKLGPQIVRPAASRGAAATQMARTPEQVAKAEPVIAPKPVVEKPKPVDTSKPRDDSGLLSFAADPMPVVKKGPVIGNPRAERSSPMPDNGFLSSYHAPAKSGSGALKFMVGGAAVLVLAGAVFGFSRMGHRTTSVSAATRTQEASAPVQTPVPEATLPSTSTPVSNTSVTSTPVRTPVVKEVASKTVSEVKASETSRRSDEAKPVREQKAEPQPELAIKQPNGLPRRKPADVADVQAPTLVAGLSPSTMPDLRATVVPPKADFPTATVSAPKLLNGPRPVFPQAASVLHLTGDTVVLNAKVMANGRIGDINVVRGNRVFVDAVKDAVKHWQYAPAQLNNQPTEATVEIVFKFGQGK